MKSNKWTICTFFFKLSVWMIINCLAFWKKKKDSFCNLLLRDLWENNLYQNYIAKNWTYSMDVNVKIKMWQICFYYFFLQNFQRLIYYLISTSISNLQLINIMVICGNLNIILDFFFQIKMLQLLIPLLCFAIQVESFHQTRKYIYLIFSFWQFLIYSRFRENKMCW